MWLLLALLSAVFAALTAILAKVGIEGVNSHLATAIRTVVVLALAWGMVFLTNAQSGIADISRKCWIFLVLSGFATGASWLCYFNLHQFPPCLHRRQTNRFSSLWIRSMHSSHRFFHLEYTDKYQSDHTVHRGLLLMSLFRRSF